MPSETRRPTSRPAPDLSPERLRNLFLDPEVVPALSVPETSACRVRRCLQLIIERHCDERLTLSEAASACHVSPSQLNRLLLASCGMTFKRILTLRRLLEASRLLATTSLGVGETAERAGFGDVRNMQRAYRRHLGVSPSQGRRTRINVAHLLSSGLSIDERRP